MHRQNPSASKIIALGHTEGRFNSNMFNKKIPKEFEFKNCDDVLLLDAKSLPHFIESWEIRKRDGLLFKKPKAVKFAKKVLGFIKKHESGNLEMRISTKLSKAMLFDKKSGNWFII